MIGAADSSMHDLQVKIPSAAAGSNRTRRDDSLPAMSVAKVAIATTPGHTAGNEEEEGWRCWRRRRKEGANPGSENRGCTMAGVS